MPSGEYAHDIALLHDEEFLAIKPDLCPCPFSEQDAVADLEVNGDQLARLVAATWTDPDDLAFRGLFLGRVRNDDAALGLCLRFDTPDDDAVMQWTKFGFRHRSSLRTLGLMNGIRSGPNARMFRAGEDKRRALAIARKEC